MKNVSSFKTKYPDVRKVNIKSFCLIFNTGMAAGIIKGRSEVLFKVDTTQRQLESLFAADKYKAMDDWNNDPDLRSEWEDNFDAYLGFVELHIAGLIEVVIRQA